MDQNKLRQIPLVALFAALAIIFPQLFHFLGLGPAFLPMFIPVLVGSMFLTWRFVLLLAVLSPGISWLITGMPPLAPPILPVLILELSVAGLTVSILRMRTNLPTWLVLIFAVVVDRLILFILTIIIGPLLDISHPFFSVAVLAAGIPGIILQFMTVPLSVYLIEKKYPDWRPVGRKNDQ